MSDAEVVISPEVNRSDLNKMNKQFQRGFKKVADDAEQQIQKGVTDGIKKGTKSGGRFLSRIGGGARRGFDSLGGARGIATGIGGIALAGLINRIDRAAQGQEAIQQALGESTAAGTLAGGRAAGLTPAELGQFTAQIRATSGVSDQAEIDDLLQDINVKVQEAVTEGGGLMEQFGDLQGQERINTVLAELAGLDFAEAQQMLDAMGISGTAARALLPLIDSIRASGGTFEERKEFVDTTQAAEGQEIGQNLMSEAEKAKLYRDAQLTFNEEMKQKLLDKINPENIQAAIEGQRVDAEKQVQLVEEFTQNQADAIEARKALNTGMEAMNETMGLVVSGLTDIKNLIEPFIADQPVATTMRSIGVDLGIVNSRPEGSGGASGTIDRSKAR